MSRVARLFELLELLQSSGTRSVPDLASRLGIDERTARRDIEALRELGVPVEAVRGRYGGYRIGTGYRMPPLMLDDDEALAVLVGLVQAGASSAAPADATALASATAKVRRSLPRGLGERADALLDSAVLAPGPAGRDGSAAVDPDTLLTVAGAVRERRPLALVYRNRTDERTSRSVQPHDLVARAGRWYLVGLDAPSREVRSFRLDRIVTVRALGGTFPEPAPHDPVADLVDRFATAEYRYLVRLRTDATEVEIRRHLPPSVAIAEAADDGWFRVTIHAESLTWVPAALVAIDGTVAVEAPDELRTELANAATRLRTMAGR